MFTGLIEEIGRIQSITKSTTSARITIKAKEVLQDIKLGDSISTNGVCLTVTDIGKGNFSVDVMPETIRNSNLKNLNQGSPVNLERALRVGDRLGGHIVSGHIDGVGLIRGFEKEENATWVSIATSKELLKYILHKGSIAIDGTSLTVAFVDDEIFKVSIIPHTKDATTLLNKKVGEEVNLENDMIGKYVEKIMSYGKEIDNKKSIDREFLKENGFF